MAISRFKLILVSVSIYLLVCIKVCSSEPFFSSKANITPVKLFHVNSRNFSTPNKRNESVIGSLGKISRVVPMKHVSKVRYNFKNSSKIVSVNINTTGPFGNVSRFGSLSSVKSYPKKAELNEVPKFTKVTTESPLILMTDSWEYLNKQVTKQELKHLMEGLSDQTITHITNVSKRDPKKGQKILMESIMSELGSMKKSRMLELDIDNSSNKKLPINKGVRFSAKQRKPVLNVLPLNQKIGKNPTKSREHWNVSGVLSNEIDRYKFMKQSSTTPTLLEVLAAPENIHIESTTPPFISSQLSSGFKPLSSKLQFEPSNLLPIKSRLTLKEDEYLLPPITTTSTVSPEVNKGHQTISESTTIGPKVIWYNHNQTPEDTFYPNSDSFLVPPEEASVEVPGEALPSKPHKGSVVFTAKTSFPTVSSEYNNDLSNHKGSQVPAANSFALQHSATNEYNGVREYFSGGTSKGNDGGKRHDYTFSHSEIIDAKNHEIIPRHQNTNRKPVAYSQNDVLRYGPVNEYEHYRDSYPTPSEPPAIRNHEISSHLYHSNDNTGVIDFVKDSIRTYDGGRYKDDGPQEDSDYFKREPKYKLRDQSLGRYPGNGFSGNGYGSGGHGWKDDSKDLLSKAKDYFKNTDTSETKKWFDISIGVLGFLAFMGYILALLYQVVTVSSASSVGTIIGRGMNGAAEMFDLFFSKGPLGQAYLDEVENVVKRAMANVKRMWMTKEFGNKSIVKTKGDVNR